MRVFSLLLMILATSASGQEALGVGRLEHGDGSTCSAVLVRDDVVLTAAHCARPGDNVVFRPGDGGDGDVYASDRIVQHPLYVATFFNFALRLRFDLAAVRLSEPVPNTRGMPIAAGGEAEMGERLFLVSWRGGEGDRPRQRACDVIEGPVQGLVTLGCEVRGGESGAPLLRRTDTGDLELVAIISSRNMLMNQSIAQASEVADRLQPLLDTLDLLP